MEERRTWESLEAEISNSLDIERHWFAVNPIGTGCSDRECTRVDGVSIYTVRPSASPGIDFVHGRTDLIWLGALDDHLSESATVGLHVETAKRLVNNLMEAIAHMERRRS